MCTYDPGKPLSLDVNGVRIDGIYRTASLEKGILPCEGIVTTGQGTRFVFTDRYLAEKPGTFELRRDVVILNAVPEATNDATRKSKFLSVPVR